jgi:hypothetical protein
VPTTHATLGLTATTYLRAPPPTPPSQMVPVDYRFFATRRYLTPARLY